ncbi:MAG TPA: 3'-5' exonuclease, partial [Spirochaetia bacterium]|nr:3'-5' exonuclease [Spirochaetia bacterium]
GLLQDGFPGTTAILYRMNAQSRHFEDRFRVEGIPYRLIGTVRFYSRQEVKDALAYLSLLVNPRDEVAFRRIANTPSRGLGPASVEKIVALRGPGESVEDACRRAQVPPRARLGVRELLGCLQECAARLEELPLSELARLLLTRSGLYEHYRQRDRSDGTSKSANLEEMVSAMAPYGAGAEALGAFLESVALANPADEAEQSGEEPKVTLITLHNTKGLEFDRVIISGLEEGIFPHDASSLSAEDLEEERRLFYVGITRARERLTMTWCLRRRIFGKVIENPPSRFLDEIPKEQINRVESEAAAFLLGRGAGSEADDYPPGAGVFHDEYGPGVVERTWYTDGSLLVQVRFQSGRVAKFLPRYTRLERIGFDE